jgi:uncharacterized protein YfaS (alpha-2-macroglobulin family)
MKTSNFAGLSRAIARTAVILVLALFAALSVISCSGQGKSFAVSTLSRADEISSRSPGRLDPIVVRFVKPIAKPDSVREAASFSPKLEGTWAVRDERTIEFTPTKPYKSGGRFTLSVDTGILAGNSRGKEGFNVKFEVHPAEYEIACDGLYAEGADDFFSFSGVITTDIPVTERTVRDMVTARLATSDKAAGGDRLAVEWKRTDDTAAREHRFTVKHIARAGADRFLSVVWKGDAVGSKKKGQKSWLVPAAGDFRVLEIAADDPECVRVRFSGKVDPSQDLRGLVVAGNAVNVRYSVDSNVVSVYNNDGWKADQKITVLPGIKSLSGTALKIEVSAQMSADWELPDVRFKDDGVILPTTQGVVVPVETRNVKGLIVEAYRVYADNILQFLQVNELDGDYELDRVGEPVWSRAFDFGWDDGMKNRYVTRGLDLSEFVKKYPDGMIQLRLTFRKRHVMYECKADHKDFSSIPMPSDEIPNDRRDSYWDMYELDWKTMDTFWTYRKDPCHPAFYLANYHSDIVRKKNVLVSDIGVMAKKDSAGVFHVAVADIRTTAPVAGAEVTAWSYVKQKIASGKTDRNGFVNIDAGREPFVIGVTSGGQTSYLRVENGMALSVSHFAVDGEKPEKGVKGFIYGERGVWRPGDDIHLVFVLQDPKNQFPKDFPIKFELQDPNGRTVKSAVYSTSVGGFYRIDTATASEDPTGAWIARVSAGGRSWTKSLRIEAVVPNRLAINLKTAKSWLGAENNEFTLTGAWLYGAAAPGLKADVSAIFYPGSTTFDGYSEYTFVNSERSVESEQKTVWEGNLDRNSQAKFSIDLDAGSDLPGKLRVQLNTRIFEPSGMFSIDQARYEYSPYDRYVGIRLPKGDPARGMLLTDTKHRVDIALVDPEGKPVKSDATISVSLYKLEWRWWWEKDALTDASFVEDQSENLIAQSDTVSRNGRGSWEFEVKYPDWGRYLVVARDKNGGHSTAKVVYIDWPGWAGRGQEAGTGSAAMLTLTKDKDAYRSGENTQISFPSSAGGRALVTVEKDGDVVAQTWLETAQGTTVWKLPLLPTMAPNVYVHVTLLQPHLQTANSLPIRLYGVIPLMVENPETRLAPVIKSAVTFEPGKKASLSVSEASGRPMTYTVAVVDEGLLGLTRFKTANPWDEFYKKEASRLASWDLYRYVMSAWGGKLETLLSIGGSEDLLNGNNKKAERFKPVVLFFGPFELAAGATNNIDFDMPQYVGAVRVMVVAGKNAAYGTAEKTVPVKGDLMVIQTLPRTIGANEAVSVPVTIFNGRDSKQSVTVDFSAEGAVKASQSLKVDLPAMADKTVTFRLDATARGVARVKARVTPASGGNAVESVTEIDILSRGTQTVTARRFTVTPGGTWRNYVPSPGEKGSKSMNVEFSTLPVLDLRTRLDYLLTYPHGCIEQITSGGFPQLYLPGMVALNEDETARVKKNVLSVLGRYSRYQTASGGFGYWPGDKEDSLWGTSYAGHFMVEAKKAGYDVPDSLYKPWLAFQQNAANAWVEDPSGGEIQAYRLYTLALSGNPEIGAMNRLSTNKDLSIGSRWLLAGAYSLAGHRSTAASMTDGLELWPAAYRDSEYTYGSELRDSAIALNTLNAMGDSNRAATMVPRLAENFGSDRWLSTQETAWTLLALSPHYKIGTDGEKASWTVEWDKGTIDDVVGDGTVIRDLEPFESPTQTVVVNNTGSKNLYGKVTTRGMLPAGSETKTEKGLALTVQYLDDSNRPVQPRELAQGDSFTLRVTVTNLTRSKVENLALSVPVPTCWEFANNRVAAEGDEKTDGAYTYRDIKDTGIMTYFNLAAGEIRGFVFPATVAYDGNYYVPAISAMAMYDPDYQTIFPGQYVQRIGGSPAK